MGDLKFSYCVLSNNPDSHTIQNVTGYSVDSSIAVGESTNIGFASNIGPREGNWNFYASGAAPNYFKGQIQTGLGTAAAPAVSFIGDSTGTFSPAAGTWAVSTGGTERLRVDSTGDLLAATGYTPANPQSLVTKAYADNLFQVLTQAEYDAIGTPDPDVLYLISG